MNNNKFIILASFLILFANCGNKNTKNANQNAIENDTLEIANEMSSEEELVIIQGDTLHIKFNYFLDYGDTLCQPIIKLGKKIIYDFKKEEMYAYGKSEMKMVVFKNTTYILFSVNDPLSYEWLIVEISGNKNVIIHKNINQNILQDVDNDGIIEIGGTGTREAVCIDCDSVLYYPHEVYKLGNTLKFDSINSRKLTEEEYGFFLGYKYLDTIVIQKK